MLLIRLIGVYSLAFSIWGSASGRDRGGMLELADLVPGYFLRSPDPWVGLAIAAVFIVAAVQLRRYRGPG
jgi:hypothetical protein